MSGSNLMHGWVSLLGALAIIAMILLAIGIMLGVVKLRDALKHTVAIVGIVIGLTVVPDILGSAWSIMSLWQQIGLIAIGIAVFHWLRPRQQSRNRR